MATRISGKRIAAGVTTAAAVGGAAIVGVGAVALNHPATTQGPSISPVDYTGSSGQDGSGSGNSTDPGQSNGQYGSYSGSDSVQPGSGGPVVGKSSGS